MKKISILIADDHPVVRDGLQTILETQDEFKILGSVQNGIEVINQTKVLNPDIILLDLEMPEMDGVETLKELRSLNSQSKVIVFTAYDTDDRIMSAIRAGAKGYLLKGVPREDLFNAIKIVFRGETLLQPVVARKLMEQMSGDRDHIKPHLTKREMDVLNLLGQGKLNKEIAQDLSISERTAKFHVSSIFKKLDVQNRTEAVTKAAQVGLIDIKKQ